MLAYFHKNIFIGLWQDQSQDETWLERTARALGHQVSDVEVYQCPPLRSDAAYYFDENKNLVVQASAESMEIEGVVQKVYSWHPPQVLTKIHPAP